MLDPVVGVAAFLCGLVASALVAVLMNRFIRNAPFWARTTTFIIVLIVVTGSLAVVLPRINFDDDDVLPSASAAPSASSDSLSPSPSVLPTVTLSPDPTSPLPEPTVVSSPPPPQYTWQYLAYKPPVRNDGLSLADSSKLKNGQEFKHALWAGKGDWSIHSRSATYVLASRCTKLRQQLALTSTRLTQGLRDSQFPTIRRS